MADTARDMLATTLSSILESGEHSDLQITCGTDIYKVHKVIVCSQSAFFRKAIGFQVGKEATEGIIDLPEDDPDIVKQMVSFLYEAEYEPKLPKDTKHYVVTTPKVAGFNYGFPHTCAGGCPSDHEVCPHHSCYETTCGEKCLDFVCGRCASPSELPPIADASQLLVHTKMYEIGDKYDIPSLKALAQHKFSLSCKKYWNDDQFAIAAEHALTSTPDQDQGLRDILDEITATKSELLEKPEIETLLRSHPDFMFRVLKKTAAIPNRK